MLLVATFYDFNTFVKTLNLFIYSLYSFLKNVKNCDFLVSFCKSVKLKEVEAKQRFWALQFYAFNVLQLVTFAFNITFFVLELAIRWSGLEKSYRMDILIACEYLRFGSETTHSNVQKIYFSATQKVIHNK